MVCVHDFPRGKVSVKVGVMEFRLFSRCQHVAGVPIIWSPPPLGKVRLPWPSITGTNSSRPVGSYNGGDILMWHHWLSVECCWVCANRVTDHADIKWGLMNCYCLNRFSQSLSDVRENRSTTVWSMHTALRLSSFLFLPLLLLLLFYLCSMDVSVWNKLDWLIDTLRLLWAVIHSLQRLF